MTDPTKAKKTKVELAAELEVMEKRLAQMETKQMEFLRVVEAMRESEQKYRILLDDSSDPIFSFNAEGQYQYVNQAFANGVGRSLESIRDRRIWDVFPQDEADKRFSAVKWVFENKATKVIEVRVPRPDGDRYYITTVKPVFDDFGQVVTVICISKEITERKRMEEELLRLSTHDTLTGLYNRNFYEAELHRLQYSRLYPVSIVVLDMDHLKTVNDQYGHFAGDRLLQKAAQCMRITFRAEDIVARIGGDEFGVLLPGTDELAAQTAVERLREQVRQAQDSFLRISIGTATAQDGSNLQDVMREADDRMYLDKFSKRIKIDQV